MTILVYDQVAHMYHIMFTWSQFTCYNILVILLFPLPWGSNVFCRSVLGYRYICSKFITAYLSIVFVRLNLFNHVLALFRAKFTCNLAIRYPVFRLELCKGSVWESVKKNQVMCNSKESRDWILQLAHNLQVTRMVHIWSMQGELKGHDNWSTIRQNFQPG